VRWPTAGADSGAGVARVVSEGNTPAQPASSRPSAASGEWTVAVVGIGADGWDGLGAAARAELARAEVVVGSSRQLALLPASLGAERRPLPSPLAQLFASLPTLAQRARTVVLASGDPMLHGIGATLADRFGPEHLRVYPHPSALAYVCARLGWPEHEVTLVSSVAHELDTVRRWLQPGRRLCVYTPGRDGAARLGALLAAEGFGTSPAWLCERLGADDERITPLPAGALAGREADPLHCVAVALASGGGASPASGASASDSRTLADGRGALAAANSLVPGIPEGAFAHDGQITKWPLRALALAALRPLPGELLWDVGAGSGAVAIEWARSEPSGRAIAIERRADRCLRIRENASRFGVPAVEVVEGEAPAAFAELEPPSAIFVGGGTSSETLLSACLAALEAGGRPRRRLVAHAVTVEGEQALVRAAARYGGELLRVELADLEPLGRLRGWRPRRPIVQWAVWL